MKATVQACILAVLMSALRAVSAVPVTSTPSALSATINEEAGKIYLEDISYLITKLKKSREMAGGNLDFHCNWLDDSDFPPEFGKSRCRDYAAHVGTSHMDCDRPFTNPALHNGVDTSIQATSIEVMGSLTGHTAMLKALTQLPSYSVSGSCYPLTESSPNYFTCVLNAAKRNSDRAARCLSGIMEDLEVPEESVPGEMSCEADASRERKAPLGVWWKIEADAQVHIQNMRSVCETVKQIQGNTDFSCP